MLTYDPNCECVISRLRTLKAGMKPFVLHTGDDCPDCGRDAATIWQDSRPPIGGPSAIVLPDDNAEVSSER